MKTALGCPNARVEVLKAVNRLGDIVANEIEVGTHRLPRNVGISLEHMRGDIGDDLRLGFERVADWC